MKTKESTGYGFGTFQGVFTPSILTIIGVVMYLRFGWMLGNVGLETSLLIVTAGSAITLLTGLSISALATNLRMKGGGAYFMLSRSFGAEAGAALGIPLALSQAIGVSFYIAGFAEAVVNSGFPITSGWDPRIVGLVTLAIMALVGTISASVALKSQYFIMAAIAFSLVSFFAGGSPAEITPPAEAPDALDFWVVFAVFFPAVTGILSGVGMSGDLKNPSRSIPLGTICAVLTGYVIYMAIPIALNKFVPDPAVLRTDTMIFAKCARWAFPILLGVWAATLSSAIGSFLCAPRVAQALARDRVLPRAFGIGWGATDDPRFASAVCFGIAAAGLWFGDINAIAPILTMFNLSTYALLNLSAALETAMGNPSWRPTFRVKAIFSFSGFALCVGAMFMISPGWTFAAIACEFVIFWIFKRRSLRARWGDMRTGLFVSIARFAMNKLEGHGLDVRNWRPDVLAFVELPVKSDSVITLARAVSCDRGMVTLASVVPAAASDPSREANLEEILRSSARKSRLTALARVHAAKDVLSGMKELVRAYGFGPFVPDTIVLRAPKTEEEIVRCCDLLFFSSKRKKNVIIIAENSAVGPREKGSIDVWWRGRNRNGPFMLALAHLIRQSSSEYRTSIRLCQLCEAEVRPDDAKRSLSHFTDEARINADLFIQPYNKAVSPIGQISVISNEAKFAFIGLRPPNDGEKPELYAEYFSRLMAATANISHSVFALAAEDIDFMKIFSE